MACSNPRTTLESRPPVEIRIPLLLWARLVRELRRRGGGRRESGAFLLGKQNASSSRVVAFVCYDDMDVKALESGAVTLHADGYAALWQRCRERALRVLGDIHTHPGRDIRQSSIDERHPMIPIVGHTAMIAPDFGRTLIWSLAEVGVYEYLGSYQWRAHPASRARRRVSLCLW